MNGTDDHGFGTETPPPEAQTLLDTVDGDRREAEELAELFLRGTRDQLEAMKTAAATGQFDRVRPLAHKCSGSSSACGLAELADLLRTLELLPAEERPGRSASLVAQAEAEFLRVERALRGYFAGKASS